MRPPFGWARTSLTLGLSRTALAFMDTESLAQEWVAAQEADDGSIKENHWSVDYVIDLHIDGKSEELWSFIKCAYTKDISDKVVSVLAAGPLEDLLNGYGEKYIDEIEALSRRDPAFRYLLGGVWQSSISDEVWGRVCKAVGQEK